MSRPVRVPGSKPEEWSSSARAELAGVVSPAGGAARPLHLPLVIACHPTFLPPYLAWAKAVALHGVLSHRDNALLALRTALLCDSEFEWGVPRGDRHRADRPRRRGDRARRGRARRRGLVRTGSGPAPSRRRAPRA